MGQGKTNARTTLRDDSGRVVPRRFYDRFAMVIWRCLVGFMVCVFGVTNAIAQTSEKIVVLPRLGTPSCELDESVIRFRIQSEVDSSGEESTSFKTSVEQVTLSGRLDVRSADTKALIGQVAISPDSVSEPITISQPGIYDVQMRVPRDHSGWQRWLRLDSLTDSDATDVARSWTVVVLPENRSLSEKGPAPTVSREDSLGTYAAKKIQPRQVMTRVDVARLRSWCSSATAELSKEENSLLSWKWRSEGEPVSRDAMIWQARLNCLTREIKSIQQQGVDGIVLPIVEAVSPNGKTSPGNETESEADGFSPMDDALLVRMAAEEMILADGQVWLEPPRLPCGATAKKLVRNWNQFWGEGRATGFVVRWESDTIQCRQCGHHHGTDALLPIIADLNDQHLILAENATEQSTSTENTNRIDGGLPPLQQALTQIRSSQPGPATEQVWLLRDQRRQPPPRLSTHFQVVASGVFGSADAVWLGHRKTAESEPSSSFGPHAVLAEEMDEQWIRWWDEVSPSVNQSNASSTLRFVLTDLEMLDTSSGAAACHAWKNWNDELSSVSAEASAGKQKSIDGLLSVTMHSASHSLIFVNRAPWPMNVTLTTTDTTTWSTKPSEAFGHLTLTVPEQTPLGARLKLPPGQIAICQSESPLPRHLAWTGYVTDPGTMIPRITEQVTMVVEHVGLLSELDRLDRDLNATSDTNETQAAPARSSIDRWNPGRVIQASTTLLRSPKTSLPPPKLKAPVSLLTNGDFEQKSLPDSSARLGIPNWMHAQHPANAVKLDSRSAFQGEHSVRLAARDSSGTQAWLISKNIATPDAGRVAISMALRGFREPSKDLSESAEIRSPIGNPVLRNPVFTPNKTHRAVYSGRADASEKPSNTLTLRVALEGSHNGQPCRHWREIEVPDDGKWQNSTVVLEWLNIDVENTRDLRVTIDNLSDGVLWVDNVVVTDWFASRAERAEIQSLAYLAVQGLQRDDLKAPAQLLNQFWAKQLLQFAKQRATDPRRAEVNPPLVEPVFGRATADMISVAPQTTEAANLEVSSAAINAAGLSATYPLINPLPVQTSSDKLPTGTTTDSQTMVDSPMQNPSVTGRIRNWLPHSLRF